MSRMVPFFSIVLLLSLQGCGSVTPIAPVEEYSRGTPKALPRAPRKATSAIPYQPTGSSVTSSEEQQGSVDPLLGLLQKIKQAMKSGAFNRAEGLIERALRIDAQRAELWHDLARVRYRQKVYQEAETLARRSNMLATGQAALQQENWRLIARAREMMGDAAGAAEARKKAGL